MLAPICCYNKPHSLREMWFTWPRWSRQVKVLPLCHDCEDY